MAIRQIRLPDPAGTPRVTIADTPTSSAPSTSPSTDPSTNPSATPLVSPPDGGPSPEPAVAAPVHRATTAPASDTRPWYHGEAWLAVEVASVVPVIVALFAPQAFRGWLVALAATMIVAGLAMLVARDRATRDAHDAGSHSSG
jgi:hypothetical protein